MACGGPPKEREKRKHVISSIPITVLLVAPFPRVGRLRAYFEAILHISFDTQSEVLARFLSHAPR